MSRKKRRKRKLNKYIKAVLDMGIFLLVVLVITYILSEYVVERITIVNHSMEKTLSSDDSVLIDKISYRFKEPERFDIIVFKQNDTGEELIKRVYGLPYETIQISEGEIYINGEIIEDIKGLDKVEFSGLATYPVTLSAGEYFVLGDNREISIDSRYSEVGTVKSSKIIGKMFLRILPIKNFKFF